MTTITQPQPTTMSTRERIMLYGGPSAGKSKAWSDILRVTDGHMWIIDNEMAADRTIPPTVPPTRYTIVASRDYKTLGRGLLAGAKQAEFGDWIVVDMMGTMWQTVQDYWREQRLGLDAGDMMFHLPDKGKGKPPEIDWTEVKSMFSAFWTLLLTTKAHVLGVYGEKEIVSEGKWQSPEAIKNLYGKLGVQHVGNKTDPHEYHTVLHLARLGPKRWGISTAKDREREGASPPLLAQHNWTGKSFAKEYLVDVAGWEVQR